MKSELFDYHLPPDLIAQTPSRRRDQSRLMILNRATGSREITHFRAIVERFRSGDVLVVNDTKVFKARLFGKRKTGGVVEIFLVRPCVSSNMCQGSHPPGTVRNTDLQNKSVVEWEALVSPSRRVNVGEEIIFGDKTVQLVEDIGGGRWIVGFQSEQHKRQIMSAYGHVPLPVYMKRDDSPTDIRRYQTVYADSSKEGAVAAPTAGFHFTQTLLAELKRKGVKIVSVTLHVGPGTFKPLKADNIDDHVVDPEFAELPQATADAVNRARKNGNAIFAVGTTSVRTLESSPGNTQLQSFSGMVDLYIKHGHAFRFVDHMITNFHLPKSSLLILVSAFAGRENVLAAYRHAIAERMRFYSYGDAMLIL